MPALDLALCHRMIRPASGVWHSLGLQIFGKVRGEVAGTIVAEQSRPMPDVAEAKPRLRPALPVLRPGVRDVSRLRWSVASVPIKAKKERLKPLFFYARHIPWSTSGHGVG